MLMKTYKNPRHNGYIAAFSFRGREFKAYMTELDECYGCSECMIYNETDRQWTDYCRRSFADWVENDRKPSRRALYLCVLEFKGGVESGEYTEDGEMIYDN